MGPATFAISTGPKISREPAVAYDPVNERYFVVWITMSAAMVPPTTIYRVDYTLGCPSIIIRNLKSIHLGLTNLNLKLLIIPPTESS